MEKTIRFGIIGAGRISRRTAKAMLKMKEEGIRLCAVASRDAAKAEAFAAELAGGAADAIPLRCYGSYEELAADPEIDAVYIGLINSSHAPAAELCLAHGKAVLCEKPFFIHAEDARACMELARQKDLLIMEAMWTRTIPAYRQALQWIEEGRIGKPVYVRAEFGSRLPDFMRDPAGRMFDPDLGGGILWDCGIYPYEYVTGLFGRPDEVRTVCHIGSTGVDETTSMTLRYDSGLIADCFSSVNAATGDMAVIYGTEGRILQPRFFGCRRTELLDRDGNTAEVFEDPEEEGFVHDIRHFAQLWRTGRKDSPYIPLADTLDFTVCAEKALTDAGYGRR